MDDGTRRDWKSQDLGRRLGGGRVAAAGGGTIGHAGKIRIRHAGDATLFVWLNDGHGKTNATRRRRRKLLVKHAQSDYTKA